MVSFARESFDLVALIKNIVADLQQAAAKKNIYLKFDEPTTHLPLASADKERATQVFINLAMNGIQYTDQGGITITIEDNKPFLRVLVSDTGIGISAEFKKSIFKKFGTAGKSFIHSKEYGSGLGLYICKLLVEAMGGTIELVKSQFGAGSTFGVLLPEAENAKNDVIQ